MGLVAVERTLAVPGVVWGPLALCTAAVLAWHRWAAPRPVARRQRKRREEVEYQRVVAEVARQFDDVQTTLWATYAACERARRGRQEGMRG